MHNYKMQKNLGNLMKNFTKIIMRQKVFKEIFATCGDQFLKHVLL